MINEHNMPTEVQDRLSLLKEEALRDRDIIRTGISPQALAVLKKRCGYDLPVFQTTDPYGNPYSDQAFIHQAMLRDGKREVICYIETCLNGKNTPC